MALGSNQAPKTVSDVEDVTSSPVKSMRNGHGVFTRSLKNDARTLSDPCVIGSKAILISADAVCERMGICC